MSIHNRILIFFLAIFTISFVVIAIVLPYGLNVNGTLEGYLLMGASNFEAQANVLARDAQTTLRPMLFYSGLLSYSITLNSFFGANILNFGLIILKSIILFYIIKSLDFHITTALAIAVLFAIFPTNTTSLRLGYGVQPAIVTLFIAILLLIRLNKNWRNSELILMSICLVITMLIYEVSYMLILFAPMLLILKEQKITKRIVTLSIYWYTVSGLVVVRWLYFYITLAESYQQDIVSTVDNSPIVLLQILFNGFRWNLIGVWYRSLIHLYNATPIYLVIAGLTSLLILFVFIKLPYPEDNFKSRHQFNKLVFALVIIALGYAMFLVVEVRTFYERVFVLSSVGSAMFIICALQIMTSFFGNYQKIIFSTVFSGLIFLSLITGLRTRDEELVVAFQQQMIVSQMVEQMPDINISSPTVVLFAETGELTRYVYLPRIIEVPLQILYDNGSLNAFICYPNTTYGWQDETCDLQAEGIFYQHQDDAELFPYSNLIAFMYKEDGAIELLQDIPIEMTDNISSEDYDSLALICDTCAYSSNTNAYFTHFPFEMPQQGEPVLRNLLSDYFP